jgi:hypothetical protein
MTVIEEVKLKISEQQEKAKLDLKNIFMDLSKKLKSDTAALLEQQSNFYEENPTDINESKY